MVWEPVGYIVIGEAVGRGSGGSELEYVDNLGLVAITENYDGQKS